MENTSTGTELLENVVINDVGGSQYTIHRLAENSSLLNSELLQSNGLVVDLTGGEFIPVNYPSEALLANDLTEEDRNLAAALVAVQLSQQQKQQQLQDSTLSSLSNKILGDNQLILPENLYIDKQTFAKIQNESVFGTTIISRKSKDDEKKHIENENRNDSKSSRKVLPHKKRISKKLKKNCQSIMKFECNQCNEIFNSNDEFSQHSIICQTTINSINRSTFCCQICNDNYEDQLQFFEHLKTHYEPTTIHIEQQTPITTQNQKSNDPNDVKDNILQNLLGLGALCNTNNTNTNSNTTNTNNKTFRKQKNYENNIKEENTKLENNEFSETEDLMEGINVVVSDNQEQNSDSDSKTWYKEEDLHQTEEDLKELDSNQHICHICKQPFSLRAILLQHLITCRVDSGIKDSTVKKKRKRVTLRCSECDRVFTHRNSLVYHIRSHSGIRPHQCDQCGKSFFASSALKVHLRLHSGDKPYHCVECGKNFRQWGDLKYHMTSIHSTERQFQCEYCGKDFARKYSLIVHRRIHTGERNYKCEFCSKTFRASSYLQNHRKIHTGEKPHECETCGKPFRVRSDMKRHQKTHHSKRLSCKNLTNSKSSTAKQKTHHVNIDNNALEDATTHIIPNYEQDPLDTSTVRDGSTLYSNGSQLFLVSYTADMKSVDSAAWIQTTS